MSTSYAWILEKTVGLYDNQKVQVADEIMRDV